MRQTCNRSSKLRTQEHENSKKQLRMAMRCQAWPEKEGEGKRGPRSTSRRGPTHRSSKGDGTTEAYCMSPSREANGPLSVSWRAEVDSQSYRFWSQNHGDQCHRLRSTRRIEFERDLEIPFEYWKDMRNSLSEDMEEFRKVCADVSYFQSQMHPEFESAESIVDSDFEDGELRKWWLHHCICWIGKTEPSRMPTATRKRGALLQEKGASAERTQADLRKGLMSSSSQEPRAPVKFAALFSFWGIGRSIQEFCFQKTLTHQCGKISSWRATKIICSVRHDMNVRDRNIKLDLSKIASVSYINNFLSLSGIARHSPWICWISTRTCKDNTSNDPFSRCERVQEFGCRRTWRLQNTVLLQVHNWTTIGIAYEWWNRATRRTTPIPSTWIDARVIPLCA